MAYPDGSSPFRAYRGNGATVCVTFTYTYVQRTVMSTGSSVGVGVVGATRPVANTVADIGLGLEAEPTPPARVVACSSAIATRAGIGDHNAEGDDCEHIDNGRDESGCAYKSRGADVPPVRRSQRSVSTTEPSVCVQRLLARLRDPNDHLVAIGNKATWPQSLKAHRAMLPRMTRAELHFVLPAIFQSPRVRLVILTGSAISNRDADTMLQLVFRYLPASRVVCLNLGELASPLFEQLPAVLRRSSVGHVFVETGGQLRADLISACSAVRSSFRYKRDIVEDPVVWRLATTGGAHCFWDLQDTTSESLVDRHARYVHTLRYTAINPGSSSHTGLQDRTQTH